MPSRPAASIVLHARHGDQKVDRVYYPGKADSLSGVVCLQCDASRLSEEDGWVQAIVEVELIDLVENLILWDDRGLSTQGQHLEAESEEIGRAEAIELLVQRIVDGAQSNW